MSTENEGLLEVRDLKVHFPLPKKSLFGERSYVKAVDGVSFRVRKAPRSASWAKAVPGRQP